MSEPWKLNHRWNSCAQVVNLSEGKADCMLSVRRSQGISRGRDNSRIEGITFNPNFNHHLPSKSKPFIGNLIRLVSLVRLLVYYQFIWSTVIVQVIEASWCLLIVVFQHVKWCQKHHQYICKSSKLTRNL